MVAAIEAKDVDVLREMWPAPSWDALGTQVLDGFVPASDSGDCARPSATTRECFVFEQGAPFVLGLSMQLQNPGWVITAVSLDPTN